MLKVNYYYFLSRFRISGDATEISFKFKNIYLLYCISVVEIWLRLISMKKIFFYFLFFLLALQSQSQTQYGIKAGASITSMKGQGWSDKQPKFGFVFGFIAESNFNARFFLKPELVFSTKGFKFDGSYGFGNGSLDFNYLSVPFLFGFRPTKKISLLAGPEIGYLQDVKSKDNDRVYDLKNNYSRFDFCANIGCQFKIGSRFGAELRYSHGLIDLSGPVIPHPLIDYMGLYKAKHQSLQLNLFYLFSGK